MHRLFWGILLAPLVLGTAACENVLDDLPTTPDPVISVETFSGTLNVNGGQTHQFFTSATGVITATLTSLGDTPPQKVGFSMGTMSGATCTIVLANDQAVVTTVVTGTVSSLQGALCMRIYDVGVMTGPVDYTFTVSHP